MVETSPHENLKLVQCQVIISRNQFNYNNGNLYLILSVARERVPREFAIAIIIVRVHS